MIALTSALLVAVPVSFENGSEERGPLASRENRLRVKGVRLWNYLSETGTQRRVEFNATYILAG